MQFNLPESVSILQRTPRVLDIWLRGLSESWTHRNEGGDTWSPFDVLGHMVHGERTDWIPRLQIILNHGTGRAFDPFDRFAQFESSRGKTVESLLDEFSGLRSDSLARLEALDLQDEQFSLEGLHPELGVVTLGQLVATWAAHDLTHIAQLARVLAFRYDDAVGPWKQYLGVLNWRH